MTTPDQLAWPRAGVDLRVISGGTRAGSLTHVRNLVAATWLLHE